MAMPPSSAKIGPPSTVPSSTRAIPGHAGRPSNRPGNWPATMPATTPSAATARPARPPGARVTSRSAIRAKEIGSTSSATHTGTKAMVPPAARSTCTSPIPARHSSVVTAAEIAAAAMPAAVRQRPAGIMVPVASASSRPSRAATAAPRKPTHSVRCWTNGPEPGIPALNAARHTISASGSTAISASAVLEMKLSRRASGERRPAGSASGISALSWSPGGPCGRDRRRAPSGPCRGSRAWAWWRAARS